MELAIFFWLPPKKTTTFRVIFILESYLVNIMQYLIDKAFQVFSVCGRHQLEVLQF